MKKMNTPLKIFNIIMIIIPAIIIIFIILVLAAMGR